MKKLKGPLSILILIISLSGCNLKTVNSEGQASEIVPIEQSDFADNKEVSAKTCSLSGRRIANAKVDIGYDSDYAKRDYWAYTNEAGQLVRVSAPEIIIQNDQVEAVKSNDRYCNDEAKVKGVEESDLDEGHVIADSLGGASNAYNITPQESELNRHGTQAQIEEDIRDANGAKNFEASITYPNNKTQIPSEYQISYEINGKEKAYTFANDDSPNSKADVKANNTEQKNNNDKDKDNSSVKQTQSTNEQEASIEYDNCSEVRAAGANPISKGEPGWQDKFDRDGDGVACE